MNLLYNMFFVFPIKKRKTISVLGLVYGGRKLMPYAVI